MPALTVRGTGGIRGGRVEVDASLSGQFASALLIAAAGARAPLEVALTDASVGGLGYVDITLAAMRASGGQVQRTGPASWDVRPGPYRARVFRVEPEASTATYFWAAGALTGDAVSVGADPGSLSQPDAEAWRHIAAFPWMDGEIDGSQMQDAVPTLAVMAAFGGAPGQVHGASPTLGSRNATASRRWPRGLGGSPPAWPSRTATTYLSRRRLRAWRAPSRPRSSGPGATTALQWRSRWQG